MTARTPVQRQQSLAARKRAAGLREVRSLWLPLDQHKVIRAIAPDAAAMLTDALRYRLLRRGQHWSVIDGIGDGLSGAELDSVIDAELARLRAAREK